MIKKRTLIFAILILILVPFFLYGCRADIKESAADTTNEETDLSDETFDMTESVISLTEDRLSGTWIGEYGFVCRYSEGVFYDNSGIEYTDCKITESGISGVSDYFGGELVNIGIRMFADDTLEVNEMLAVKAGSDKGKKYQKALENQLEGDWITCDGSDISYEFYTRFADGKFSMLSLPDEENRDSENDESYLICEYAFENGILSLYGGYDESDVLQNFSVHLQDDLLRLAADGFTMNYYRKGSQAAEDALSGKSLLTGEWVFVSSDNSEILHWSFDGDSKLSIEGYGTNEIQEGRKYSVSRQDAGFVLIIDEKEFIVESFSSLDGNSFSLYDGYDFYGTIYSVKGPAGLEYIEKAKTIYSTGEITSRTYFQKSTVSEISSVSLTLDCMSNLWLDDVIAIIEDRSTDNSGYICGASYEVSCTEPLKNASITFTYNPDQFLYDCEEDLSVAFIDSESKSFKLIPTKVDSIHGTATAEMKNVGTYALVDSLVFEGGTRDISELNPSNTPWAMTCDTGDIISLIDLDYIEKSNGYFSVTNASELASVAFYVNTNEDYEYSTTIISIENDIDLSGYAWAPMGWTDYPEEHPFSGWINGNSHTISGLTIDSNDSDVGFIGWGLCSVYDLTLNNASVSGSDCVGVLVGQAIGGEYLNCHAEGTVRGNMAGSLIGYEASITMKDCSADVLVNGELFDFLSWNEKEKSEIIIEDPVTITMDAEYTVTRPEVTGYQNLGWMVIYNGEEVLHRNAENEYSYQYFANDPGTYEIYLTAYVSGQYVPISNTLTYTIE